MIHPELGRQGLQLAIAVHHTGGTDVVALGQKQFNYHLPVLLQSFRLGLDHHPFGNLGDAGRHQPGITLHLNQAQATTTPIAQALQVTKGGDIDPCILGGGQDTLRR